MLSYADALRSIFRRVDYERVNHPPYGERVWRLDRVRELLAALGNPQQRYRTVHVAGTKGKGSTTAMIESILRADGYRTGMYTSPHLHTFRERIRVGGDLVSEEDLAALVQEVSPLLAVRPELTVFEIITALAMLHFAKCGVEHAVVEVGLGGRLDATNVLIPDVSVITSISLDHTKVLGNTIGAIAGEKAGIIKPGVPVVSAPQVSEALSVIKERAGALGSELILCGRDWKWRFEGADLEGQSLTLCRPGHESAPEHADLRIPLLGEHQLENATAAVAAVEALRARGVTISPQAIRRGLAEVRWPGRMEVLSRRPLVVLDGAHNPDSIQRLLEALHAYLTYERLLLVCGVGTTHVPATLLGILMAHADETYLVRAHHAKATPLEELSQYAQELGYESHRAGDVADGLAQALDEACEGDLVLVAGSLFVVGEARTAWAALNGLPAPPVDPPDVY